MAEPHTYTVVSLFSGAMGLDLGLEATDRFRVLACVEKVPAFCETIRVNRDAGRLGQDLRVIEADVSTVDPRDLLNELGLKVGELDLLVGGPPCQSFSTAGRRGTTQDPRGTLLWQYLRFLKAIKPKFFLMENVRGLISAALRHRPIAERPPNGPELSAEEQPGSVVQLFSEELQAIEDAQYHMDIFEVNAVNYGAPQIRERVLFLGNRFGAQVNFPDPTHVSPTEVEEGRDLFSQDGQLKPWATLRDAIGDLVEEQREVMDFSPRKKGFLKLVPPGSNWRSLPREVQQESMGSAWHAKGGRSGWWRRLTLDLPCPTLVTMPNHASTALCHPTETRALSVQEYARIQEFPSGWQISGSLTEKYAQIGNAVPVRLGKVAGEVIANSLDSLAERGWRPFSATPTAYRVVYIKSHVRTRRWFKDGKTVVWSDGSAAEADYGPAKTHRKARTITTS